MQDRCDAGQIERRLRDDVPLIGAPDDAEVWQQRKRRRQSKREDEERAFEIAAAAGNECATQANRGQRDENKKNAESVSA